jgi:hypothetical protein
MIPLAAALSIAVIASLRALFAPSVFLPSTSEATFLERVFSLVLRERFFRVIFFVCLALFMADLFFFGAVCAGNDTSYDKLIR